MRLAKIFLPGEFEDAFVYMGWLNILTTERSIRMYNLAKVSDKIDRQFRTHSPIATYFFARNDWLNSGSFKALMSNSEFRQLFFDVARRWPEALDGTEFFTDFSENIIDISSQIVLDIKCYNTRFYMGTSQGLFDLEVHWEDAKINRSPRKRLDYRCINISTGYNTLNASCGNEGLFTGLNEFQKGPQSATTLKHIMDKSVRSGWMGYDIVNYRTNTAPFLLKTKHEKQAEDEDTAVITQIEAAPFDLNNLYFYLQSEYGLEKDSVQFAFNSNRYIFVHTYDGDFYSLSIDPASPEKGTSFTKTHKGAHTRILSAASVKPGLIIEAEDRVLLFANEEWHNIVNSPALSVRTFANSKRFQNLILVTTCEGLWIVSAINDSEY